MNFSCTSDGASDIYWKYIGLQTGSSTVNVFDKRGLNEKVFDERFVKTVNGFTSILTIHNVRKSDEGTYFCHDSTSARLWPARLTVVGKCVQFNRLWLIANEKK